MQYGINACTHDQHVTPLVDHVTPLVDHVTPLVDHVLAGQMASIINMLVCVIVILGWLDISVTRI